MSNQADVRSIEQLKLFRSALAVYSEDTMSALGAVDMEARRMVQWLQHDRPAYWREQIKKRREQVAAAKAEVFRRQLAKTAHNSPSFSEQKEILRQAEASLQEAEMRAAMVRKWEPILRQAILEYHGSIRRIKDLASGDIPRASLRLERIIEALEAYLRVSPPSGAGTLPPLDPIADTFFQDADEPSTDAEADTSESGSASPPADESTVDDSSPPSSEPAH